MNRPMPCIRPRTRTNSPCASIRVAGISSTSELSQPPIPVNRVSSTVANTITDTCQIAPIATISRNSVRYSSWERKLRRVTRQAILTAFMTSASLGDDPAGGPPPQEPGEQVEQHDPAGLDRQLQWRVGQFDAA